MVNKAALKAALQRYLIAPLASLYKTAESSGFSRRALVFACFAAAFLGFSLLMVKSFVMPFDGIKVWGENYKDCGQFPWNLWIVAESVLDLESPLWTDRVSFPVGANLAQHTLASGFLPLTLLVKLFSWNSPIYPIVAYNIAIWLSFTLLLAFGYLALREAGFGFWASIVPAVGYAFSCFYYRHWLHLNLMAGFLLPLLAYLLIRLYKKPTLRRGLVFGFFIGAGVYFTELSLSAVIAMALFFLACLAIGPSRRGVIRVLRGLGVKGTIATVVIAILVAAPLVWVYSRGDAVAPNQNDFARLGANAVAYILPAKQFTSLYGDLLQEWQQRVRTGINGGEAFLGYPFILCMLLGLFRPRSVYTLLALFVGACFVVLSFGTTLRVFESSTDIKLPYHWLREVPPFNQNRAPVRFVAVAHLLFIFLAASGIELVRTSLSRLGPIARDASIAICTALLLWTVAETHYSTDHEHVPYEPPPKYALNKLVNGAVLQWPTGRWPCNQVLIQIFHGHPIENSCLARGARSRTRQAAEFHKAFEKGGEAFSKLLAKKRITNLLVTDDLLAHELEVLRAIRGVNIVEIDRQPSRVVATWGDTKSEIGRHWHKAKKWRLRPGVAKLLGGKGELTATRIDILADWDDEYHVELLLEDKRVVALTAAPLDWTVGGQWRFLDVPRSLRQKPFDSVKITATGGDGRYNVASIAVLK